MVKQGRGPRGRPRGGGADLQKDLQLIQSDPRFAHVASDPKYRHIPKKERKVKLDSRFHSILTDEKFYEKSTMDPRGRKGNYSTKEDLLRFYHMSSDEDSDDDEEEEEEEEGEDKEEEEEEEDNEDEEEDEDDKGDDDEENEEEEGDSEEESDENLYISIDGKGKKDKGVKGSMPEKENEKMKKDKEKKIKKEKGKKSVSKKEGKDENDNKEQEETENEENSSQRDKEERSEVTEEVRSRLQDLTRDYARGGGDLFSDDSSDDDSTTTDEDDDEGLDEFEWAELDQDAVWDNEVEVEETNRIAICNLDWDRIKAADLMVLFSSFCPLGGSVRCITIYPSEYGKKRMEEEDRSGPQELTGRKKKEEEEEEVDEEAEEYFRSLNLKDLDKLEKGKLDQHSGATKRDFEALRRYQRNRLRYFYAVMECDGVETARSLYMECDRQPFEGAGIVLDMRYVPSDMVFDETPHDLCRAVPQSYRAKSFVTTALQSTRPALTWDETNPDRAKALGTAMAQALKGGSVGDDELRDFLASSSEEEEDAEKAEEEEEEEDTSDSEGDEEVKSARIAKFRALIQEIDEKEKRRKEKEIDMEEVLDEKEEEAEEEEEEEEEKEQNRKPTQLNPFEKYLEKRNAKKKEKRKKQKKKKMEEEEDAISDDELPEGMDDLYSDPFFADELKKRDKEKKKVKKRRGEEEEEEEEEEDSNDKANLELLLMEEEEEDKKHFNMREIIKSSEEDTRKKRRKKNLKKKMKEKQQEEQKKKTVDDFKVNLSDARFSELLTAGEYNIDPSHPQFKRTKAMDGLISEIQKKRRLESGEEVPVAKKPHLEEETKRHLELASLVQRVKRKTGKGKRPTKRSDPDT